MAEDTLPTGATGLSMSPTLRRRIASASGASRAMAETAARSVGTPFITPEGRFADIPEGYNFAPAQPGMATGARAPSSDARFASLPAALGGGQFTQDPKQIGSLVKSTRGYDPAVNAFLRGGLSSRLYEIEHVLPLWAGGTDNIANKQLLSKKEHEKKTKVGAVARKLYYSGKIDIGEAKVMLHNWRDKSVKGIKLDDNNDTDIETAYKKVQEWKLPKKVTLKSWWGAMKEGNKGVIGELAQSAASGVTGGWIPGGEHEYEDPEEAKQVKIARAIGVTTGTIAGFFGLGLAIKGIGMALGLTRLVKGTAVMKKMYDAKTVFRVKGITVPGQKVAKVLETTGLFATHGQLSKQHEESFSGRSKRFLSDVTMGGMVGAAGYTIKGFAGLGLGTYTLSYLEGADEEDALINAAVMVGLHGIGLPKARKIKAMTERLATESAFEHRNKYLRPKEDVKPPKGPDDPGGPAGPAPPPAGQTQLSPEYIKKLKKGGKKNLLEIISPQKTKAGEKPVPRVPVPEKEVSLASIQAKSWVRPKKYTPELANKLAKENFAIQKKIYQSLEDGAISADVAAEELVRTAMSGRHLYIKSLAKPAKLREEIVDMLGLGRRLGGDLAKSLEGRRLGTPKRVHKVVENSPELAELNAKPIGVQEKVEEYRLPEEARPTEEVARPVEDMRQLEEGHMQETTRPREEAPLQQEIGARPERKPISAEDVQKLEAISSGKQKTLTPEEQAEVYGGEVKAEGKPVTPEAPAKPAVQSETVVVKPNPAGETQLTGVSGTLAPETARNTLDFINAAAQGKVRRGPDGKPRIMLTEKPEIEGMLQGINGQMSAKDIKTGKKTPYAEPGKNVQASGYIEGRGYVDLGFAPREIRMEGGPNSFNKQTRKRNEYYNGDPNVGFATFDSKRMNKNELVDAMRRNKVDSLEVEVVKMGESGKESGQPWIIVKATEPLWQEAVIRSKGKEKLVAPQRTAAADVLKSKRVRPTSNDTMGDLVQGKTAEMIEKVEESMAKSKTPKEFKDDMDRLIGESVSMREAKDVVDGVKTVKVSTVIDWMNRSISDSTLSKDGIDYAIMTKSLYERMPQSSRNAINDTVLTKNKRVLPEKVDTNIPISEQMPNIAKVAGVSKAEPVDVVKLLRERKPGTEKKLDIAEEIRVYKENLLSRSKHEKQTQETELRESVSSGSQKKMDSAEAPEGLYNLLDIDMRIKLNPKLAKYEMEFREYLRETKQGWDKQSERALEIKKEVLEKSKKTVDLEKEVFMKDTSRGDQGMTGVVPDVVKEMYTERNKYNQFAKEILEAGNKAKDPKIKYFWSKVVENFNKYKKGWHLPGGGIKSKDMRFLQEDVYPAGSGSVSGFAKTTDRRVWQLEKLIKTQQFKELPAELQTIVAQKKAQHPNVKIISSPSKKKYAANKYYNIHEDVRMFIKGKESDGYFMDVEGKAIKDHETKRFGERGIGKDELFGGSIKSEQQLTESMITNTFQKVIGPMEDIAKMDAVGIAAVADDVARTLGRVMKVGKQPKGFLPDASMPPLSPYKKPATKAVEKMPEATNEAGQKVKVGDRVLWEADNAYGQVSAASGKIIEHKGQSVIVDRQLKYTEKELKEYSKKELDEIYGGIEEVQIGDIWEINTAAAKSKPVEAKPAAKPAKTDEDVLIDLWANTRAKETAAGSQGKVRVEKVSGEGLTETRTNEALDKFKDIFDKVANPSKIAKEVYKNKVEHVEAEFSNYVGDVKFTEAEIASILSGKTPITPKLLTKWLFSTSRIRSEGRHIRAVVGGLKKKPTSVVGDNKKIEVDTGFEIYDTTVGEAKARLKKMEKEIAENEKKRSEEWADEDGSDMEFASEIKGLRDALSKAAEPAPAPTPPVFQIKKRQQTKTLYKESYGDTMAGAIAGAIETPSWYGTPQWIAKGKSPKAFDEVAPIKKNNFNKDSQIDEVFSRSRKGKQYIGADNIVVKHTPGDGTLVELDGKVYLNKSYYDAVNAEHPNAELYISGPRDAVIFKKNGQDVGVVMPYDLPGKAGVSSSQGQVSIGGLAAGAGVVGAGAMAAGLIGSDSEKFWDGSKFLTDPEEIAEWKKNNPGKWDPLAMQEPGEKALRPIDTSEFTGMIEAPTIDLSTRPSVDNMDGSFSSVKSMSFEEDGIEILIPTVVGNRVVSDEEAIRHYKETGEHLGKFKSADDADRAGRLIHEQEERNMNSK